ncbi:hypothetical protein M427DRAFT_48953 [Gonapodya prolifera JEL478]|uniref:Uncharacterized protein n=1 Tax=Gonapodya prolifera (strain JEL478) TaxID=1344416 RepID=A0A138ZZJ4_GONPJ|nr:hypothetical protein M427DRAFT_48953 [Gonapodya prolifera JEL478]|eukprot:KXS09932.1 hypothetical protein M427DRAFT_48953 [Gonapodya prolifera JEL478]
MAASGNGGSAYGTGTSLPGQEADAFGNTKISPHTSVRFVKPQSALSRFLLNPWSGLTIPLLYIATAVVLKRAGISLVPSDPVRQTFVQAAVAGFWMGGVGLISFGEAWVKFHAPTTEYRQALDVGRHVFSFLNKVELIVASYYLHVLFYRPHFIVTAAAAATANAPFWTKVVANAKDVLHHTKFNVSALAAPLILLFESAVLLPALLVSAKNKVEYGVFQTNDTRHKRAHLLYALSEVLKFAGLATTTSHLGNIVAQLGGAALASGRVMVPGGEVPDVVDVSKLQGQYWGDIPTTATALMEKSAKTGEELVGWMDKWKK